MSYRLRSMLFVGVALSITTAARADLVSLNNGGELRGVIDRTPGFTTSETLTIETLAGTVVTIARKDVRFVTFRRPIVEDYETRARNLPRNSVDAQWTLAEWCRVNGLSDQRRLHLERIVELDPEHEASHRALRHVKYKSRWMPKEDAMLAQGYVKYKSRYITPQEFELIEKTEAQRDLERQWFKDVRTWIGWLNGRHVARRNQAIENFRQIRDPNAVAALKQFFEKEKRAEVRAMYVEILSMIPGTAPVAPLVNISLEDSNHELRYRAMNAIKQDQYASAMPYYLRGLRSDDNDIVRRAGTALARVGDDSVVPHLIDALITNHSKLVRVPAKNSTMSFNTNGSSGPGAGQTVLPPEIERLLRTGQLPYGVQVQHAGLPNQHQRTKVVRVKYDSRNAEVHASLQRLTGRNFGYDERTWRLWWSAKKNGGAEFSIQ